jgi:hypothetical protein
MTLKILDKQTTANLLISMWQKDLNTTEDPTNGRWLENGANGDNVGLIGGLVDITLPATVQLAQQINYPVELVHGATAAVDNRNGLNSGVNTLTLNSTSTTATTATWSYTNAVKVGVGVSISINFLDIVTATGSFSIEYSHETTESTGTTQTVSSFGQLATTVEVPAGKIYMVVLVGTKQAVDIPYSVDVQVSGSTETWFENRINGAYNWTYDIGTAFAKVDNPQYINVGNGNGNVLGLTGRLHAENTTNFRARVLDITNNISGTEPFTPPPVDSAEFLALINDAIPVTGIDLPPTSSVVVYDDSNCGGYAQELEVGRYDWGQIHNDTISSLRVPAGMKVTLYFDTHFEGKSMTFTQDTPYVGDEFNDQTSSIIVELI